MTAVLPFPSFPCFPSYQWERAESGGPKKTKPPGRSPAPKPVARQLPPVFRAAAASRARAAEFSAVRRGTIRPVTDAAQGVALVLHSYIRFQNLSLAPPPPWHRWLMEGRQGVYSGLHPQAHEPVLAQDCAVGAKCRHCASALLIVRV